MFSKLLKHDCRAMFKYWWVTAASSVFFSIISGFCANIVSVSYTAHTSIQTVARILLIFSIVAILLCPVLSAILMFRHFNKNFFNDEGYLTFTLPVSKGSLLTSKLLTGVIFAVLSIKVLAVDAVIALIISGEDGFEFLEKIPVIIKGLYYPFDFSTIASSILFNLSIIAFIATSTAFVYLCITLSNMLVKRHRLLTGLGIFYGVQIVLAILIHTFISNRTLDLIEITLFKESVYTLFLSLALFAVLVIFGAGIYLINLYLLDKKLNLE